MSNLDSFNISRLIDIYGKLLTQKQLQYMLDYYFNNLSLSEIAENEGISKQAVDFAIKNAKNLLNEFDNKLDLLNKFDKITNLCNNLSDDVAIKINEIINK